MTTAEAVEEMAQALEELAAAWREGVTLPLLRFVEELADLGIRIVNFVYFRTVARSHKGA